MSPWLKRCPFSASQIANIMAHVVMACPPTLYKTTHLPHALPPTRHKVTILWPMCLGLLTLPMMWKLISYSKVYKAMSWTLHASCAWHGWWPHGYDDDMHLKHIMKWSRCSMDAMDYTILWWPWMDDRILLMTELNRWTDEPINCRC